MTERQPKTPSTEPAFNREEFTNSSISDSAKILDNLLTRLKDQNPLITFLELSRQVTKIIGTRYPEVKVKNSLDLAVAGYQEAQQVFLFITMGTIQSAIAPYLTKDIEADNELFQQIIYEILNNLSPFKKNISPVSTTLNHFVKSKAENALAAEKNIPTWWQRSGKADEIISYATEYHQEFGTFMPKEGLSLVTKINNQTGCRLEVEDVRGYLNYLKVTTDRFDHAQYYLDPSLGISRRALKESLDEASKGLRDREQVVIRLRFFEGKTYEEISRQFGVTLERIRQIETSALLRLRRFEGWEDFIGDDCYVWSPKLPSYPNITSDLKISFELDYSTQTSPALRQYEDYLDRLKDLPGVPADILAGVALTPREKYQLWSRLSSTPLSAIGFREEDLQKWQIHPQHEHLRWSFGAEIEDLLRSAFTSRHDIGYQNHNLNTVELKDYLDLHARLIKFLAHNSPKTPVQKDKQLMETAVRLEVFQEINKKLDEVSLTTNKSQTRDKKESTSDPRTDALRSQVMNQIKDRAIGDLKLPGKISNTLRVAGIRSLGKLKRLTLEEASAIFRMDYESYHLIQDKFDKYLEQEIDRLK